MGSFLLINKFYFISRQRIHYLIAVRAPNEMNMFHNVYPSCKAAFASYLDRDFLYLQLDFIDRSSFGLCPEELLENIGTAVHSS